MDTSEQYIKMCEKAKEIQKLKPNRWGDCISAHIDKEWFATTSLHLDRDIWLPRQDQLQEIYLENKGGTPAQLASLIPMLRFYLIDEEGNENEIYFSDKISPRHLKKIAELKGKSIDEIINYNPEGGGETGITSFSWHYNNKHEGDYIIEADLELYFGSLVELANVEYLKFLGATGNVTDISETLKENAAKSRKAEETSGSPREAAKKEKTFLSKLQDRITEYEKVLKNGNKDLRSLARKAEPLKRKSTREL